MAANAAIELMTRQRSLFGIAVAYLYAALLVAGPWIFTILGILGLSYAGCSGQCDQLMVFRSIVIYNSLYSLVVTAPLAFFSGRYVSDQLYVGRVSSNFFAFLVSITLFCVIVFLTMVPFYVLAANFPAPVKFAAVQNVFVIGVSWLLIPFLGAFRAERAVLLAFGANALSMTLLARLISNPSAATLLAAFNASFAAADAMLLATLIRRFGTGVVPDRNLLGFPLRKWELPAIGFAYAFGIWVDKVIMWYGAPSGTLSVGGALRTMPSYDTAMFWAQLASIPVVAVAFVHVETEFSELFERFHRRLEHHASLREITAAVQKLRYCVVSNIAALFVALAIVATMTILLSFVFMTGLGLRPAYMSILRISLLAMAFHTSAMFCCYFLFYFDLCRPALLVLSTFAILNLLLTTAFLAAGQAFYGYGTMIAAAITFIFGFVVLLRELPWLHYHAFVTNNTSL